MKRKFTNIHVFSEAKNSFHEKGATIVYTTVLGVFFEPIALLNRKKESILRRSYSPQRIEAQHLL